MDPITKRNLENKIKIISRQLHALCHLAPGKTLTERFKNLPQHAKEKFRHLEQIQTTLKQQLKHGGEFAFQLIHRRTQITIFKTSNNNPNERRPENTDKPTHLSEIKKKP